MEYLRKLSVLIKEYDFTLISTAFIDELRERGQLIGSILAPVFLCSYISDQLKQQHQYNLFKHLFDAPWFFFGEGITLENSLANLNTKINSLNYNNVDMFDKAVSIINTLNKAALSSTRFKSCSTAMIPLFDNIRKHRLVTKDELTIFTTLLYYTDDEVSQFFKAKIAG